MNMDTNTIMLIGLSFLATFFAYKYVKQRMDNAHSDIMRNVQESREEMWRTVDDLAKEVDSLNRKVECCAKSASKSNSCYTGSVSH
jgi:hypothetical protein